MVYFSIILFAIVKINYNFAFDLDVNLENSKNQSNFRYESY